MEAFILYNSRLNLGKYIPYSGIPISYEIKM